MEQTQQMRNGAPVSPLGLLAAAAQPPALSTIAIAGAIESAHARGEPAMRLLRGLDPAEFTTLLDTLFPGARSRIALPSDGSGAADDLDVEFAELLRLLLEAAEPREAESRWLACAIASAALFDNHLWQDLQLPDRKALSTLLATRFGTLARRNTAHMRWKAFFYKQLCDRAGAVCRSPSCAACDDYNECFGTE
jgi:nitrogen fixation protein NifQ